MNRIKAFLKDNWIPIFAILYLVVPVDLIPDFLPVVGKLDDTSIFIIDLIRRYLDSKRVNEKN